MLKRDLLKISQYLKNKNHDPWLRLASDEEEQTGARWIIETNHKKPFQEVRFGPTFADSIALDSDWMFIGIFRNKSFYPMKIEDLLPH